MKNPEIQNLSEEANGGLRAKPSATAGKKDLGTELQAPGNFQHF